jgi:hypothetical protein
MQLVKRKRETLYKCDDNCTTWSEIWYDLFQERQMDVTSKEQRVMLKKVSGNISTHIITSEKNNEGSHKTKPDTWYQINHLLKEERTTHKHQNGNNIPRRAAYQASVCVYVLHSLL